ncbi:sigma-70 family RNA polymerase sigma factor [Blautia difficilis]|uniref:sigma-70 family RNA polymerase sigma factor n=1 Tax=Blautia difficilis TaxID=2763027 RepID=UPI003D9527E0
MTASQRTANPNGCAEPTKKEDDGIDTNIEALEEYICDNICRYREEDLNQEELDYFCHYCELQKHTDGIKAEYDKINHFDHKKTHYSLEILKQQTIPREKMPEEIVAKIMREETLRKSLEQLSDREREILLGRFYYRKSSTELGRQMNLSPGNVRMIQKRALEKLRMIMEKQGE